MASLFLRTFGYSSVSMRFLAVGTLPAPTLVHLLSVRLKPLKCAASEFLIVFLEACSSESFLPQERVPFIQETHYFKKKKGGGRNESTESACHSVAGKQGRAEGQLCPTSLMWVHYGPAT